MSQYVYIMYVSHIYDHNIICITIHYMCMYYVCTFVCIYHSILTHLKLLTLLYSIRSALPWFRPLLSHSRSPSSMKHSQHRSLTLYDITFTQVSTPIILSTFLNKWSPALRWSLALPVHYSPRIYWYL